MTTRSQKDKELFYLERFRTASGLLSDAEVRGHEVPDFLLPTTSAIIGLEVTQYFIPSSPNARPRQEQEALRRRVLTETCTLYDASGGGPIRVSVYFSDYAPIGKTQISHLARRLVTLVLNYQLRPWERIEVQWEDGLLSLPEIASLAINGYPGQMKSEWVSPDGGFPPNVAPKEIQAIVDAKAARIPRFPAEVSSKWLLIVLDGFSMSSTAWVTPELMRHPFQCPFDRLFLLEAFGSRVHELSVRDGA